MIWGEAIFLHFLVCCCFGYIVASRSPNVKFDNFMILSTSEEKSALKISYRYENPGPTATDGALGITLFCKFVIS